METKSSAGSRIGIALLIAAVVAFTGWRIYSASQAHDQQERIDAFQDSGWKPPTAPPPNPQDAANNAREALKQGQGK